MTASSADAPQYFRDDESHTWLGFVTDALTSSTTWMDCSVGHDDGATSYLLLQMHHPSSE